MAARKKTTNGWTDADYEAVGKGKLTLRLDLEDLETLGRVAYVSNTTRQQLVTEFVRMLRDDPELVAKFKKMTEPTPIEELAKLPLPKVRRTRAKGSP